MIYFVRHGESETNAQGLFSGSRIDAPLTLKGREQAKDAGEVLAAKVGKIDRIFASTLQRSQQTAIIIAKQISFDAKNIKIDPRIAEYDMGSLSGMPIREVEPATISLAEGAESPATFYSRIMNFFNEIKELDGVSLVVGHAWIERMLDAHQRGWPPEDFYKVQPPDNAEIMVLTF